MIVFISMFVMLSAYAGWFDSEGELVAVHYYTQPTITEYIDKPPVILKEVVYTNSHSTEYRNRITQDDIDAEKLLRDNLK